MTKATVSIPKPGASKPTAILKNLHSAKAERVWKRTDMTTEQKVADIRQHCSRQGLKPYIPMKQRPTRAGKALVFGTGDAGQLGLGEDIQLRKFPAFLADLNEAAAIVDIAAGGMHSVALDDTGHLWSWGCNDQYALGRSSKEDEGYQPLEMRADDENVRFVKVVCADSMTIALSETGTVYTCGTFRNSRGNLGFDPHTPIQTELTIVKSLASFVIVDIACGVDHVLALSDTGVIFQWGSGEQAQLGRRVLERREIQAAVPRELWLPGTMVIGAGSYCSYAYTNDGTLYAWGLNNYNQSGVAPEDGGFEMEIVHPTRVAGVSGPDASPIVQIQGGEHHTIILREDGQVWSWGRGDFSQLGLSLDQVRELNQRMVQERGADPSTASAHKLAVPWPQRISTLTKPIRSISAGGNHNLVIDADGTAYSWGYGESMQLASGEEEDRELPAPLGGQRIVGLACLAVAGGGHHSVLLAAEKPATANNNA